MIADLAYIKYKNQMVEKMNVDKTASPKTKPARSSNRSPVKNDAATRPLYTPAKAATTNQPMITNAHIENINRIAQADRRSILFESAQPVPVEIDIKELVDISSSKSQLYKALCGHGKWLDTHTY